MQNKLGLIHRAERPILWSILWSKNCLCLGLENACFGRFLPSVVTYSRTGSFRQLPNFRKVFIDPRSVQNKLGLIHLNLRMLPQIRELTKKWVSWFAERKKSRGKQNKWSKLILIVTVKFHQKSLLGWFFCSNFNIKRMRSGLQLELHSNSTRISHWSANEISILKASPLLKGFDLNPFLLWR